MNKYLDKVYWIVKIKTKQDLLCNLFFPYIIYLFLMLMSIFVYNHIIYSDYFLNLLSLILIWDFYLLIFKSRKLEKWVKSMGKIITIILWILSLIVTLLILFYAYFIDNYIV